MKKIALKIILSNPCCFCPGVERAVNMAKTALQEKNKSRLVCFGDLVHNPQVMAELGQAGLLVLAENAQLQPGDRVLVRAHGISPKQRSCFLNCGAIIIDATCPHVQTSHQIVASAVKQKCMIIIAGEKGHPETSGLLGAAADYGHQVATVNEAVQLSIPDQAILLAQTTFHPEIFAAISKELLLRQPKLQVFAQTICKQTELRQNSVRQLAQQCDLILVVGGRHSANTRRLAEIAASYQIKVIAIESAAEISADKFTDQFDTGKRVNSGLTIGIAAGASTAYAEVQKCQEQLQTLFNNTL